MIPKSPTISIFTADTGHTSIAESIQESLKPKYPNTHLHNISGQAISLYSPFYLYFPQLFQVPFKISQQKQAQELIGKVLQKHFSPPITHIFNKELPDIVISTYPFHNLIFSSLLSTHSFHFINIVTDPRSFHALSPSPSAINLTFDSTAAKRCHQFGIKKSNTFNSGWFVRSQYKHPQDKLSVRRKLGLNPKHPTYLVAAGSVGTNLILKILPAFLRHEHPANVIFACGNNQKLFTTIRRLNLVNRKIKNHPTLNLVPLKFTQKLYLYMQAADLVIGKAGPNLIFESVATHTPFFAITHISGQEDGNLKLIKDFDLGFVEENPVRANRLLTRILNHPENLSKFYLPLQTLADYNLQSSSHLRNLISQL